ncbi:MAG TPA: hypothetical protein VIM79_27840, partial [Niastella sp.]
LLTIILGGCSNHKKCKAVFPILRYNITDVMHWDTTKYSNLVFQFYSASIEKDAPWQLICYGLHNAESDTIPSSTVYDKLPVARLDSSHSVSDSVIVGNNIIPLKLLQAFAQVAANPPYNANHLEFIPYDTSGLFKNYILYHIKVPDEKAPGGNKYFRIDTSLIAPEFRKYIKDDPTDGSNYLELNPCPPANLDISSVNKFGKYEFFTADIGLVRSMVPAHPCSNTTSISTSATG